MIKRLFFLLPFSTIVSANEPDTIQVKRIDLDEVTIVAFKQNTPNREPLSISTLDNRFLKENEISGAKDLTYIIHSGFISGYQNRYGDNLKPPTNVYHRMTA